MVIKEGIWWKAFQTIRNNFSSAICSKNDMTMIKNGEDNKLIIE